MINEIWKPIPGFDGYEISNMGRIKSHKGRTGHGDIILKEDITRTGYALVTLFDRNHNRQRFTVHRLVAIVFVPNPDNLPEVNHKDEDKLNNSPDNLEWCTKAYNTRYGTRTARTSKPILQYTKDGVFVRRFNSVREASRTLNIGSSNIHNSAVNKVKIKDGNKYICKSAGGFIWHYE